MSSGELDIGGHTSRRLSRWQPDGARPRLLRRLDQRIATSDFALWLAVAFPLLLLYLITVRTDVYAMSIDTVSVTPSAWELAHHGTPRLPAHSQYLNAWMIASGHGGVISNRAPGLIGLAAMAYWLLRFTSNFDVSPASLTAAVVTAAAMGTLALCFRRLVAARTAALGALIAGTATTTWAVSSSALWPHGPDQLYLSAAMLALAGGGYLAAGGSLALAVLTRPPLAVVAVVFGVWQAARDRSVRALVSIGGVTAAGLVVFLAYSQRYWGGGLQSQYVQAKRGSGDFIGGFLAVSPHAWATFGLNVAGTFLSPGRGVLVGAPFLIVLALGLPAAWRAAPPWVRMAATSAVLYLFVQLKANDFGGGSAFWSYRYPLEPLTLLAPLLLLSWSTHVSQTPRRRSAFFALVIVAVALQAAGAICFRRPNTNWWGTNDLAAVVEDRPFVAGPILFVGYLAAAITYRRLCAPLEGHGRSVLAGLRTRGQQDAEPSEEVSAPVTHSV